MKSAFFYTNPKRTNSIKPLNLLFKYNFTIKLPKTAIIIMAMIFHDFQWFSMIFLKTHGSRLVAQASCLTAKRRWFGESGPEGIRTNYFLGYGPHESWAMSLEPWAISFTPLKSNKIMISFWVFLIFFGYLLINYWLKLVN